MSSCEVRWRKKNKYEKQTSIERTTEKSKFKIKNCLHTDWTDPNETVSTFKISVHFVIIFGDCVCDFHPSFVDSIWQASVVRIKNLWIIWMCTIRRIYLLLRLIQVVSGRLCTRKLLSCALACQLISDGLSNQNECVGSFHVTPNAKIEWQKKSREKNEKRKHRLKKNNLSYCHVFIFIVRGECQHEANTNVCKMQSAGSRNSTNLRMFQPRLNCVFGTDSVLFLSNENLCYCYVMLCDVQM